MLSRQTEHRRRLGGSKAGEERVRGRLECSGVLGSRAANPSSLAEGRGRGVFAGKERQADQSSTRDNEQSGYIRKGKIPRRAIAHGFEGGKKTPRTKNKGFFLVLVLGEKASQSGRDHSVPAGRRTTKNRIKSSKVPGLMQTPDGDRDASPACRGHNKKGGGP